MIGGTVFKAEIITYSAIAIRATPAFDELSSITDSRISLPSQEDNDVNNPYLASVEPNAIPELYDIPIGLVNSVLYRDALRRVADSKRGASRTPAPESR